MGRVGSGRVGIGPRSWPDPLMVGPTAWVCMDHPG